MNTTANIKSAMMACAAGMMLALTATAQTRAEREIEANPRLAAGKYMAYEAPQGRPTPPPEGYSPCYISTYARHGSRYLTGEDKYEPALTALAEADRRGALTPKGKRALAVVEALAEECGDRYGELTPKGAAQHRALADRMFANYPEIFADGTHVDARSTYKTRAFLSMAAACIELKGLNPRLNITTDASEHDAYYLKYKNPVYSDSCQQNADSAFAAARERFVRPDRLMRSLFADDYLAEIDDPQQLMVDLFEYHGISQSSYAQPDLGFLFTTEELFDLWQLNNFEWYYEQGPSPLSGGHMPRLARNLLRNIVEPADTCLAPGGHAALRPRHQPGASRGTDADGNVRPAHCRLGLDSRVLPNLPHHTHVRQRAAGVLPQGGQRRHTGKATAQRARSTPGQRHYRRVALLPLGRPAPDMDAYGREHHAAQEAGRHEDRLTPTAQRTSPGRADMGGHRATRGGCGGRPGTRRPTV